MKLKLKSGILSILLGLALTLSLGAAPASAVVAPVGGDGSGGGGNTAKPTNTNQPDPAIQGGKCADIKKCDLIDNFLNPLINFLAALVGVAVVVSIIIGGIQYGSSGGDPAKVTAAKNRIRNAILALLTFFFLYGLLEFLIPGGSSLF